MTDVHRVAGALFAKIREVDQVLYWIHLDVIIIQNSLQQLTDQFNTGLRSVDGNVNLMTTRLDTNFDRLTIQLDLLKERLDNQSKRNWMWFLLIVGINIGMYWSVLYMLGMLSYQSMHVPTHCNATNVTDGHYSETVMRRSDLRIIAEWFAWPFVRP